MKYESKLIGALKGIIIALAPKTARAQTGTQERKIADTEEQGTESHSLRVIRMIDGAHRRAGRSKLRFDASHDPEPPQAA